MRISDWSSDVCSSYLRRALVSCSMTLNLLSVVASGPIPAGYPCVRLRALISVADWGFKRQRMKTQAGACSSARHRAERSFSRYPAPARAALLDTAPQDRSEHGRVVKELLSNLCFLCS